MEFLNVERNAANGRFEIQGLQDPEIKKGFVGYKTCWERIKGWVLEHIFHKAVTINITAKGDKLCVNCNSFAKCLDRLLGLGLDLSKSYDATWVKAQIPRVKEHMLAAAKKNEEIKENTPMPIIKGFSEPWEKEAAEYLFKSLVGGEFQVTLTTFVKSCEENEGFAVVIYPENKMDKECCFIVNGKHHEVAISLKLLKEFAEVYPLEELRKKIQVLVAEQMKKAIESAKQAGKTEKEFDPEVVIDRNLKVKEDALEEPPLAGKTEKEANDPVNDLQEVIKEPQKEEEKEKKDPLQNIKRPNGGKVFRRDEQGIKDLFYVMSLGKHKDLLENYSKKCGEVEIVIHPKDEDFRDYSEEIKAGWKQGCIFFVPGQGQKPQIAFNSDLILRYNYIQSNWIEVLVAEQMVKAIEYCK